MKIAHHITYLREANVGKSHALALLVHNLVTGILNSLFFFCDFECIVIWVRGLVREKLVKNRTGTTKPRVCY